MSTLCRHFGSCGGCTLQDVPLEPYRADKRNAAVRALTNAGVEAEVAEIVAGPPGRLACAVSAGKAAGA